MHTVAYMVLHTQDTLPDLSMSGLGDNCYLPNTLQGRSKLFQGGVVKVHIQHVVYRGFWAPPRNSVKLNARRSLLRPISCSVNRVTISIVATCVR